jgi:hypothetical protein
VVGKTGKSVDIMSTINLPEVNKQEKNGYISVGPFHPRPGPDPDPGPDVWLST